jgi:SPP1 gp7 family putative phage head morphogenesis protein
MYAAINNIYVNALVNNLSIKKDFESLTNTDFYETYLLNVVQFSGAKGLTESEMLMTLLFDEKGIKRTFSQFQKAVEPLFNQFNQWTRVEYELAARSAIMVEEWNNIYRDRDLFPFGIYRTRGDANVRPEHEILNGIVMRIDDAKSQLLFPPNGYNCRCWWEQASDLDIKEYGMKLATHEEVHNALYGETVVNKKGTTRPNVPEEFRHNVAIDGIILPNQNTYFKQIKSANDFDVTDFKLKSESHFKLNYRKYNTYLANKAFNQWYDEKHSEKGKNIIFQNKEWLLNVNLSQERANILGGNIKGLENIKLTIEKPSEIWGRWENSKIQKAVKFNYIAINGNDAFVVETLKGNIIDANLIKTNELKNKRKGVKFIK